MKFASKLSEITKSWLEIIEKSPTESNRTRTRCQSIRLSGEGFTINQLIKICKATRKTISGWIDHWEEKNFDSLLDMPRSGRPSVIPESKREQITKIVATEPRQLKSLLDEISMELGVTVSKNMLKRFLKKKDFHGNELGNH